MANKQLFAKIGVCVLLGLNVAAYYVFWPSDQGASKTDAKMPREVRGEVQLLPPPNSASPQEVPAVTLNGAVPLNLPALPKASEQDASDETVHKLLDHIRKETDAAKVDPPPTPGLFLEKPGTTEKKSALPGFPMIPADNQPKPLPPLKADALLIDPNVGITSALTPKVPPSPWSMEAKKLDHQTVLVARLRRPGSGRDAAEFRIYCDRLETKANGDVQALGKVTFAGAGMNGGCQRLTLPLHETRIVFEEQAYIVQDLNAGSSLRGDRMAWELAAEVRPASLGAPK